MQHSICFGIQWTLWFPEISKWDHDRSYNISLSIIEQLLISLHYPVSNDICFDKILTGVRRVLFFYLHIWQTLLFIFCNGNEWENLGPCPCLMYLCLYCIILCWERPEERRLLEWLQINTLIATWGYWFHISKCLDSEITPPSLSLIDQFY